MVDFSLTMADADLTEANCLGHSPSNTQIPPMR